MAAVLIIRTRLIAAAMVLLAAFIVMGAGSLDAARAQSAAQPDDAALDTVAADNAAPGFLTTVPCDALAGFTHERISCSYLHVRESDRGRQLMLAVAVVRARQADAVASPVVFLHGGPGGQIVRAARHFATMPINATRDVILFDQRGSGLSEPQDCQDASQAFLEMLAADLPASNSVQVQAAIEQRCHDEMINAGADLNGYGTAETVGDMDRLRRALGIEEWNLFGVSYGSTVALDYIRTQPEHTRAAVLDSVYPTSAPGGGDTATRNFVRALQQLYADCRRDDACRQAYPGLETSFLATLIALEREPLAIPVADRSLVPSGVFHLNAQDFASIIHQMMYARETISIVPMTIDRAARRDAQGLTGIVSVLAPLATRIDLPALLSVDCRERMLTRGRTIRDFDRLERFMRRHLTLFDTQDELCADWAPDFANPAFNEPVSSPVPAIFYSGANDPITPPSATRDAFRLFPNGQYVHVLHTGHGVDRSHACIRDVTAAFLDDPTALVQDACVGSIAPIPFVTAVAPSSGVLPFATGILQLQMPFLIVSLAAGVLLAVIGGLWTLTSVLRSGYGRSPSSLTIGSAVSAGAGALVLIVFAGLLTLVVADTGASLTPTLLAFGVPEEAGTLLSLPWAALAVTVLSLGLLIAAAARGGANTRPHTPIAVLLTGGILMLAVLWWLGFFARLPG